MSLNLLIIAFLFEIIGNCQEGCHLCKGYGEYPCDYCKSGYYGIENPLENDGLFKCQKCQANNCFTCLPFTPDKCSFCIVGYYMNDDDLCLKCDSNCYECRNSADHCSSCRDGNFLSNSKCFPCVSNCKACKTAEDHCTSCRDGEYLYNEQCFKCNFNCKTCRTTATNNMNCNTAIDGCQCNTCNNGYYLKNGQCLQCNSLCETCLQQDLCTQCITDYYKKENDPLNNGQNFKCYKDPEGYYLDNDIYKKCYQTCKTCINGGNKTFHNCLECNANFPFEIKRNDYINCYPNCINYYYFDNGDNFHCTSDKSCPDDYPFLLENKFECIE